jgi:nucleoid DNA-binding protein/cell division septation protein DedD
LEAGRFIKDLLYQADSVRIPGLGTFVSTYQNARTDFAGTKISPPAKSFKFDDSRKEEDELMWTWISEQEGLSETEARIMVADFVADINHEIHEGRDVVIEGLGIFSANVTGKIEFQFSVENNFNPESIGFTEIELPSPGHETGFHHTEHNIQHEEPVKQVIQSETEKPPVHTEAQIHITKAEPETHPSHVEVEHTTPAEGPAHRTKKSHRAIWITVVILLVVAGLSYLAYQERAKISELTNNWFSKSRTIITDTLNKTQKSDTGLDNTLTEQSKMKKALDVQGTDSSQVFIPYGNRHMKFYVVAASFTNYENALKMKDDLRGKGFDSEIVTVTHKYYKVTMGSYSDKQQAQVELEKLKSITQNNSLWLLHI